MGPRTVSSAQRPPVGPLSPTTLPWVVAFVFVFVFWGVVVVCLFPPLFWLGFALFSPWDPDM